MSPSYDMAWPKYILFSKVSDHSNKDISGELWAVNSYKEEDISHLLTTWHGQNWFMSVRFPVGNYALLINIYRHMSPSYDMPWSEWILHSLDYSNMC